MMASISSPRPEHHIRSSRTSPSPVVSLSSSPKAFVSSSSISLVSGGSAPQALRSTAAAENPTGGGDSTTHQGNRDSKSAGQPGGTFPSAAPTAPPFEDDAADVLEAAAAYVAASVSESSLHTSSSFANSDVSVPCPRDEGGSFPGMKQTAAKREDVKTMRRENDRSAPLDGRYSEVARPDSRGFSGQGRNDFPEESGRRDTREGEKNSLHSSTHDLSSAGTAASRGGLSTSSTPCSPSSSSCPSLFSSSDLSSAAIGTPSTAAAPVTQPEAKHSPLHTAAPGSSQAEAGRHSAATSRASKVDGETGVQRTEEPASRDSGTAGTAPRGGVTASGSAAPLAGRTASSSSLVRVSSSWGSTTSSGGGSSLGRRGDEGSLLRLFQSEYFDAYFHMYYLFHRQEPGVHEYLVNLLYVKRTDEDIIFYLPQLVQLSLVRYKSSSLHRFLLDKASKSMHLALMASWLYQSMVEDKVAGLEEPAQKMTQEVEMAVVNCKPLGGSFLHHQGESENGGEPSFAMSRDEVVHDSKDRKDHPFSVDLFKRSRIVQLIRRHQMQLQRRACCSATAESLTKETPAGTHFRGGTVTRQQEGGTVMSHDRRERVSEGESIADPQEHKRESDHQREVPVSGGESPELQSLANGKEQSSEWSSTQRTTLGEGTEDAGDKGDLGIDGSKADDGTKECRDRLGGDDASDLPPSLCSIGKKSEGASVAEGSQRSTLGTSSSGGDARCQKSVPRESSTFDVNRVAEGHSVSPSAIGPSNASTVQAETVESSRRVPLSPVGDSHQATRSLPGTSPSRSHQGGGTTSGHAASSSRGRSSTCGVTPRLPPSLKHLTGPTTVPGAKIKLPSVYGKLGNPLSLSTLQLPSLGNSWMAGEEGRSVSGGDKEKRGHDGRGCGGEGRDCGNGVWGALTGGMEEELQQFIMKQRRCDYFNTLNHFISLLIDVSTALALEPDRSLRLVLLSHFLESLNSWILCRRLYVAAMMGNSTMTGVTIPFHEVGSDVAVTEDRCLKPGTRSSSSSALSSSTSSACATPLRRRGAASSSCLSSGPSSSCVTSSSTKSTFVLSPSTSGGNDHSGKGSVGGHSHSLQILRVDLKECRALSSKKRVPYLLVFEVADLDEDLYQFGDLDSFAFYRSLIGCPSPRANGQQPLHFPFSPSNSHLVGSSHTPSGSHQEPHRDEKCEHSRSSRKHVAERRRPSSLGSSARTSASLPPSGSTTGGGGVGSRLASARGRMDETGDDRQVEGLASILPLLDWKSLYVYDCIVDELKQQSLFVPPEDGKEDNYLSAIRRSLGLQPLTDCVVSSSKGSAGSSGGAARRPSSASPRSPGACPSERPSFGYSPSPALEHSSPSPSSAVEKVDGSAKGPSGASPGVSLSGSNVSVTSESQSSCPRPSSSLSLTSVSLSSQSCSPCSRPQLRTSTDGQATRLGHPGGGEGAVTSGESVGQTGVEGTAAHAGCVGGGRQRDDATARASGAQPPVAGSTGMAGNSGVGTQPGGASERFRGKVEERADGAGQQGHVSRMKRHLWGELWSDKRERLRRRSPYGHLKSWDIRCVLVKGGDDLRQELLAGQLVRQFKAIFDEARLPLWLRPYEILVTGSSSGVMEFVPDTCSVDVLKKRHNTDSIARVFDVLFADNPFEAKKNFIESHAAYSLVSYFLQVKDRHNGNLLLDSEGHLIHIDYGYLLSNSPGNINFETSPFKLTQEFLDVMDGETSDNYEYFRTLIIRGFLEARKHADRIILLVEMMLSATKMPCFSGGPQYTLDALRDRFMIGLPEDTCIERIVDLIETSVNNFRTVQYDNFQRITNGIL